MLLTIAVDQLRSGDVLSGPSGWTALGNAENRGDTVVLYVRYNDGGDGYRYWDDKSVVLEVERGV